MVVVISAVVVGSVVPVRPVGRIVIVVVTGGVGVRGVIDRGDGASTLDGGRRGLGGRVGPVVGDGRGSHLGAPNVGPLRNYLITAEKGRSSES